jgi:carboxylate-amine ligase
VRTVGVEEELLLVDLHSGRPRAVAGQVLRATASPDGGLAEPDRVGGSLENEFKQEQLEADTTPHTSMLEMQVELRAWRDTANRAARDAGARLLAVGTSPLPVEPTLVHGSRYEELAARFGLTAAEQLTCGCHVHVSVDSPDEAVGVLDRIREWLPVLLALSANSPFWQGADSGYASFRSQAMGRWPTAGPTDVFGSAAAYQERVAAMVATGVVMDAGMIYAEARPSHQYPTVELRAPDVCLDVRDTVLVAALCRALVDTAAQQWSAGEPPVSTPTAMLRLAAWQASRDGIAGALLDPLTARPRPAREVVDQLLEHVAEALRDNGDEDLVAERVEALLAHGNGAVEQRRVLERTGQLVDVVADLARVTAGQRD